MSCGTDVYVCMRAVYVYSVGPYSFIWFANELNKIYIKLPVRKTAYNELAVIFVSYKMTNLH